jgi:hypothetical protein
MSHSSTSSAPIEKIDVSCYTVPTETPESDGTLKWEKTTLVLVEAAAGGRQGIGFSYADVATGKLVESLLADVVKGLCLGPDTDSVMDALWRCRSCRLTI